MQQVAKTARHDLLPWSKPVRRPDIWVLKVGILSAPRRKTSIAVSRGVRRIPCPQHRTCPIQFAEKLVAEHSTQLANTTFTFSEYVRQISYEQYTQQLKYESER